MTYRPVLDDKIKILDQEYIFMEHPSARGMPYGQTGRRATVYQLRSLQGQFFALKIFTRAFRNVQNEQNAERVSALAAIPGLQVCSRLVLTNENSLDIIAEHPELEYAVLMPWVDGQTWQDILLQRHTMDSVACYTKSMYLASTLSTMEQYHVAHCDLSAPNLLLTSSGVSLVDVEDMYVPDLPKPMVLPTGSMGYGHKTASQGLWGESADRFAGGVLLAEILCWCNPEVVRASYGESYFSPADLQTDGERFALMFKALENYEDSSLTDMFLQTWHSSSLEDCPPFSEWYSTLKSNVAPSKQFPRSLPKFAVHYESARVEPTMAMHPLTRVAGTPKRAVKPGQKPNSFWTGFAWFLIFVMCCLLLVAAVFLVITVARDLLGS